MTRTRCILTIAMLAITVASIAQAQHYYSGGEAIPLAVDSSYVTIRFADVTPMQESLVLLEDIGRIVQVVNDDHAIDDFLICSLYTKVDYDSFLDSLDTLSGIELVEPYYRNEYDSAILVGRYFCVGFNAGLSSAQVDSINNAHGVTVDRELEGMANVFVVRNTASSGYRMLELANLYYDLEQTYFSHPEFSVRPVPFGYSLYDYYGDNQPHIKKVIGDFNEASVWDFAGLDRMVTVAVLDDGIAVHEDLPAERILPGRNFFDPEYDASPGYYRAHGMACAGIIGASHTTDSIDGLQSSSGVISLNPNVEILRVKIFSDSGVCVTESKIAEAITYAWQYGADVLSNSWGYYWPSANYDVINVALDNAIQFGRDGLGCPVIFASGNNGGRFPGAVAYPANHSATFAVGATTLDDERWYYSQWGSELDIVAPSGNTCFKGDVWSLDQMGLAGFNGNVTWACGYHVSWSCDHSGDYDCHAGGTSAACPIVSGTAALLLARDSTLSAQQVYDILRGSAVTELDWGPLPDSLRDEYGSGRVDAFRAVLSIARGDIDNSGADPVDVSDLVYLVDWMWTGGPSPFPSPMLADVNCSGGVPGDIGDLVYLVDYIYTGGPAPVRPCFEF